MIVCVGIGRGHFLHGGAQGYRWMRCLASSILGGGINRSSRRRSPARTAAARTAIARIGVENGQVRREMLSPFTGMVAGVL
jgi:hypothetical protein